MDSKPSVTKRESDVRLSRNATVVPDNERWLHQPQAAADLQAAMDWAAANPPSDAETDSILERLSHGRD
jgi:hypothetical protein